MCVCVCVCVPVQRISYIFETERVCMSSRQRNQDPTRGGCKIQGPIPLRGFVAVLEIVLSLFPAPSRQLYRVALGEFFRLGSCADVFQMVPYFHYVVLRFLPSRKVGSKFASLLTPLSSS